MVTLHTVRVGNLIKYFQKYENAKDYVRDHPDAVLTESTFQDNVIVKRYAEDAPIPYVVIPYWKGTDEAIPQWGCVVHAETKEAAMEMVVRRWSHPDDYYCKVTNQEYAEDTGWYHTENGIVKEDKR